MNQNIETTPCCFSFLDILKFIFRSNRNQNQNQNQNLLNNQNIDNINSQMDLHKKHSAIKIQTPIRNNIRLKNQSAVTIQKFIKNYQKDKAAVKIQRFIRKKSLNIPTFVLPTINLPAINIPAINIPAINIPAININGFSFLNQNYNYNYNYFIIPDINISPNFDRYLTRNNSTRPQQRKEETIYQKCLRSLRKKNKEIGYNSVKHNNYIVTEDKTKSNKNIDQQSEEYKNNSKYIKFFAKTFTFSETGVYVHKDVALEQSRCPENNLGNSGTFSVSGVYTSIIKAECEYFLESRLNRYTAQGVLSFL